MQSSDGFEDQIKDNDTKLQHLHVSDNQRPQTPCVNMIAIKNSGEKISTGNVKSFSSFFKQIIDGENKRFLGGDVNMIDYIISKYTGTKLKEVSNLIKINLIINSEYGLLNQFGERLPYLRELKLGGSKIPMLSDLGSNFVNLVILNMDNCGLTDITGIVCLKNLVEFSAANNRINDLFEIDALSNTLKYLQLQNNYIEEMENITFLSNLEKLELLILKGNPITNYPEYKNRVIQEIPWLGVLDSEYKQVLHYENVPMKDENINTINSPLPSELTPLRQVQTKNNKTSTSQEMNEIKKMLEDENTDTDINQNISYSTTKTNSIFGSNINSLRNSVVTIENGIKSGNQSNVFSIKASDISSNKLKPVKIKKDISEEEKKNLKKIFEAHNDKFSLEVKKDDLVNKIKRPGSLSKLKNQ